MGTYESPKASHKQECSFPWPISVDSTETLPLHSEEPNWDCGGEIQMHLARLLEMPIRENKTPTPATNLVSASFW